MALWSFFNYKIPLVKEHFRVDRLGAWDMVRIPCGVGSCSKENGMDVLMNSVSKACPDCVARLRALKLMKALQSTKTPIGGHC